MGRFKQAQSNVLNALRQSKVKQIYLTKYATNYSRAQRLTAIKGKTANTPYKQTLQEYSAQRLTAIKGKTASKENTLSRLGIRAQRLTAIKGKTDSNFFKVARVD